MTEETTDSDGEDNHVHFPQWAFHPLEVRIQDSRQEAKSRWPRLKRS